MATKKSGGEAAGPLRVPLLRGHGGRPRGRPQTLSFHDHPELLRAEAGALGPAPAEQLPGGEQLLGRRQPDAAPRAALRSWAGLFQHGRAVPGPYARPKDSLSLAQEPWRWSARRVTGASQSLRLNRKHKHLGSFFWDSLALPGGPSTLILKRFD